MSILSPSALLLIAISNSNPDAPMAESALPAVTNVEPTSQPQEDAAEESKDPKWTGSVNLGASITGGNTEIRTLSLSIDAELRREKDRHTVKGWWNYADNTESGPTGDSTDVTARNAGATYKYDYFFTEKTYGFGIAGVETDDLAMLDLRWYGGVGVGRQFVEEEDFTFSGELGVTYFDEDFVEPAPPTPTSDTDYVAARVAYNLMKRVSETTVFEQTAAIFPSLESQSGPYNVYAKVDSRLKLSVTENMFAQLQWVYEWDNTPAAGAKESDNLVIASLGWGF